MTQFLTNLTWRESYEIIPKMYSLLITILWSISRFLKMKNEPKPYQTIGRFNDEEPDIETLLEPSFRNH